MNAGILAILLLILFAAFILLGVPVAFSLGTAGIIGLIIEDQNLMIFAQTLISGINNFPYLAIPFFILLGMVMEKSAISRPLVELGDELVGFLPGGLAMATVFACAIFAAISGSGPATVAAIGSISVPEMIRKGYSKRFAVGIAASAGALGPIIPPSIPFIIYGVSVEESIAKLFLGGMGAGLLIALFFMLLSFAKAKFEKVPLSQKRPSASKILKAFWTARLSLIAPFVVLGGIYAGVFTPTEAGGIGSIYVILAGLFITRTLTLRGLYECFEKTAKTSAMIMFVIGVAYLFAWIMASWNIPQIAAKAIVDWADSPFLFLIFVNVLFLLIGSGLDTPAAIVILAPILHPVAIKLGIDPIHFGTVVVVNFVIGYITPPVAYNIFVAKNLTDITMDEASIACIPFFIASLLALALITYVPAISLFFPRLFMG
jgi:C4-dicarboxylate transporter, DctM subunit